MIVCLHTLLFLSRVGFYALEELKKLNHIIDHVRKYN